MSSDSSSSGTPHWFLWEAFYNCEGGGWGTPANVAQQYADTNPYGADAVTYNEGDGGCYGYMVTNSATPPVFDLSCPCGDSSSQSGGGSVADTSSQSSDSSASSASIASNGGSTLYGIMGGVGGFPAAELMAAPTAGNLWQKWLSTFDCVTGVWSQPVAVGDAVDSVQNPWPDFTPWWSIQGSPECVATIAAVGDPGTPVGGCDCGGQTVEAAPQTLIAESVPVATATATTTTTTGGCGKCSRAKRSQGQK